MSDFLTGGTKSGTPLETRDAAEKFGQFFAGQGSTPEGAAAPFNRMTNQAMMNMLGFAPGQLDTLAAARSALQDPRELVAGTSALQMEELDRQAANLRAQFGAGGGRFSRHAAAGEGRLRGAAGAEFAGQRQQALMQGTQMRNQALAQLLGAATAASQAGFQQSFAPWQAALQFSQPGAPVHQAGILGPLIQTAGTLGALKFGDSGPDWEEILGPGGPPPGPGQLPPGAAPGKGLG